MPVHRAPDLAFRGMNDRDNRWPDRRGLPDRVRAVNRLLSGRRQPSRATELLLAVLGRILDQNGGKVTGKAILAALIVVGVVVLGFIAYRLIVLDLILRVVESR